MTIPKCTVLETVGQLRTLLASLPDDLPLHHKGSVGDHPPGVTFVVLQLAVSNYDRTYYADIEHDRIWSRKELRTDFTAPFAALCVI